MKYIKQIFFLQIQRWEIFNHISYYHFIFLQIKAV